MNYRPFLNEFDGKSPSQIKTSLFEICDTLKSAVLSFDPNEEFFPDDLLPLSLYYGSLTVCYSDNSFDDKEIKFINDLRTHLNLDLEDFTITSAKAFIAPEYDFCTGIVSRLYFLLKQATENPDIRDVYSKVVGDISLSDLFIKYLCGVVAINGDIDESETDFLDSLTEGRFEPTPPANDGNDVDVVDSNNGSSETQDFANDYHDNPAPRVIKIGGSLYKDEYNTYFSVGAEIAIEGQDVWSLDIRVQLLDSEGFILESFDERIRWVERGVFQFGKEYQINCSPSNFKIVVGARERGDLEEDYQPSKVFKVSGMRFLKNPNSYSDSYDIA